METQPVRFADLLTSAQAPAPLPTPGAEPFAPLPASVPPDTLLTMAPTTPSSTTSSPEETAAEPQGMALLPAPPDLAAGEAASSTLISDESGATPGDSSADEEPSFFDEGAAEVEAVGAGDLALPAADASAPGPSPGAAPQQPTRAPGQEVGRPASVVLPPPPPPVPAPAPAPSEPAAAAPAAVRGTQGAQAAPASGAAETYAPFGAEALAVPFPIGGPAFTDRLLSASQAGLELAQLGLQTNKAPQVGAHALPQGGAVIVQKKEAYRVQRLTQDCVASLRSNSWEHSVREWQHAAEALVKSQEIANLERLQAACAALRASHVGSCSAPLQEKLPILEKNCQQWAASRRRVAALMHQEKQRRKHMEELRKQLETQQDLISKDQEAVRAAQHAEQQSAAARAPVIRTMILQLSQDTRQLKSIRNMVQTANA